MSCFYFIPVTIVCKGMTTFEYIVHQRTLKESKKSKEEEAVLKKKVIIIS